MKFLKSLVLFLLFIFVVVSFYTAYKSYQERQLVAPVLGASSSKLRFSDNLWFPLLDKFSKNGADLANLTAKAALFVDMKDGKVLYERNSKERLPIASLTKIMTAIVALETKEMDDEFEVSKRAADMEPDKMLLIEGEKLSLRELLEGIFLVSANDASEVLAEGSIGKGQPEALRMEFIRSMNSKARQLGMNDTLFINPSGLEEDDPNFASDSGQLISQYSSAYDVSLMARYAINRWPELLQITSQPHIFIPATSTHQDYDLYSGINLLTTYPGVMGFKTGYTPEAGLTLVTVVVKGDKQVLGVLLGSTDRRDDAKALLDYSFKKL